LDQSNAETAPPLDADLNKRLTAMNYAHKLHSGPNGYPEDAMKDTRTIYLFLDGRDPLIDLGQALEEEPEGDPEDALNSGNVISLNDYRKEENKDG